MFILKPKYLRTSFCMYMLNPKYLDTPTSLVMDKAKKEEPRYIEKWRYGQAEKEVPRYIEK